MTTTITSEDLDEGKAYSTVDSPSSTPTASRLN